MSYTEAKARHYRKQERLRMRRKEARDIAFKRAFERQRAYEADQEVKQHLKGHTI